MTTTATTSRMTVGLVLDHVRARGGEEALTRLFGLLDPADAQSLRSGSGPIAYALKGRLFDAASDVLDDPRVGLRIGAAALTSPVVAALVPLVRVLASPEAVLRNVSKVSTRFDTAAVMRCEHVDRGRAELTWRVLPPLRPHRADCDYNIGLLTRVPVLFGLGPAEVVQSACQLDGADECRYEVTWEPRRRWLPRRRREDAPAVALTTTTRQLELMREAAADLVSEPEPAAAVETALARLRRAVHAPGHVVAVRLADGTVEQRSSGLDPASADAVAVQLLSDTAPSRPDLLVADVLSQRRRYGAVAAVGLPGHAFFEADQKSLEAFTHHLAAALDMAEAVQEARSHAEKTAQLLSLAHRLGDAHTVPDVAQRVAEAVPAIAASDRSVVAVFDPERQELTIAGWAGWPLERQADLAAFLASPGDAPELTEVLVHRQPVLMDASSSAWAREVLQRFGITALAAVPIASGEDLLGLVVAHWAQQAPPAGLDDHLTERLSGLARQAAVALQNVHLLERIRSQALHDPLTGLPNRTLFEERLAAALAHPAAGSGLVGVMFCDLNRFKRVNDSLGHAAGDELLRKVAQRLQSTLRATDTAARFSSDEFVVLAAGLDSAEEAHALAGRLGALLAGPFDIAGTQVFADPVVGVAVGALGTGAAALLQQADQDMYAAKARIHGAKAAPPRRDPESLALESDLHGAAERGELLLHFQPQYLIAKERIGGVEALVRWCHPVRGLVPPGAFIPIAEESGLIGEIGDWVLREACNQAASWRVLGLDVTMSVNVAVPQLNDDAFADRVRQVLHESGLVAQSLILEITESQVMADMMATSRQLQQLRDIGVGVSIDDFGTGYSSLSQLRRLPVTEVKIDRSFVAEIDGNPESAQFLEALIGLARGLRLQVVAEGVETSEQLDALGRVGCDLAQGFLLSRPVDAESVVELLQLGLLSGAHM